MLYKFNTELWYTPVPALSIPLRPLLPMQSVHCLLLAGMKVECAFCLYCMVTHAAQHGLFVQSSWTRFQLTANVPPNQSFALSSN